MISIGLPEIFVSAIVGWVMWLFREPVMNWWRNRKRPAFRDDGAIRSFRDQTSRDAVQAFLDLNRIVGDVNIRDGRVYGRTMGDRRHPLILLLRNAQSMIAHHENAINGNLYFAIKNPGEGTGWTYACAGDLCASDLGEIADLLETDQFKREFAPKKEYRDV